MLSIHEHAIFIISQKVAASQGFSEIICKLKSIESHQKEIIELQWQLGTYHKTRDTFFMVKSNAERLLDINPETQSTELFCTISHGETTKL